MQNRVTKPFFLLIAKSWGIGLLIVLAVLLLTINFVSHQHEKNMHIEEMRSDYREEQRFRIKYEVDRVVKVINFELNNHVNEMKAKVKARLLEAHAIALNIYRQNKGRKTDEEIKQIIIDALRPIRYDQGRGYYFINDLQGVPKLIAVTPEREGISLLDFKDGRGRYVLRDMIDLVGKKQEGFYTYHWNKPGQIGNNFEKISYVKRFEPYDWFIGTGVYLDAIESSMQKIILHYVDTHRFGPNNQGYVFINELMNIEGGGNFATVYANPNRPEDTGKSISDNYRDARGKMFRKEFLKGLREKGECYVDYWYKKLDNPEPSPKTSYFKLAGDGRFIVAAGVYLDDVEEKILELEVELRKKLRNSFFAISSIFLTVIFAFVLILNYLSQKLNSDFEHFADFFKQAAHSSTLIERKKIRFRELDQLAGFANQMLESKTRTAEALQNERERLLVTLHSIADGVIATDRKGGVIIMNTNAENITGWLQEEASGKNIEEILAMDGEWLFPENDWTVEGAIHENRGVLQDKEGRTLHVVSSAAPIRGDDGEILGNVVVLRDETEKLKTEKELIKVRKLESVGVLAGGIAHDFNNILAGLFGNIELALMKLSDNHEAYTHLDVAHKSLSRATNLTNQLLTFAKGGEPVLKSVNLGEMIHQVISFNLSGSRVKTEIDIPGDLWQIKADRELISQVVSNLVINASQAMVNGGTIYFTAQNVPAGSTKLKEPGVRLKIRDEGIGMSHDLLEKIFDPYFSTKVSGNGLGLAMVHSIIEKHRGKIEVESIPGKGSEFEILIPAHSDMNQAEERDDHVTEVRLNQRFLKILVIDDEESVRQVLYDMLKSEGCDVSLAGEGDEGIEKYRQAFDENKPFDIVLQDLTIPGGKDGKEVVGEILEIDPSAKVVALSGYSTDPIMARYQDYGFYGRIAKPFSLNDVLAVLSTLSTS